MNALNLQTCLLVSMATALLLSYASEANREADRNSPFAERHGPLCVTPDCWSLATNLGLPINTSYDDRHTSLTFTDLRMYLVSNRPGGNGGEDIWISVRDSVDQPWQEPQNLSGGINTEFNERSPVLSLDGHWLYFASDRPGGCGMYDLWVSWRDNIGDDFSWQDPVNLGCNVNSSYSDFGPALYHDPIESRTELIFSSVRPGGAGRGDIYVTFKRDNEKEFEEAALVPELSTEFNEYAPEVDRVRGLEIYFESDRPGGVGGLDLWVSTRDSTSGHWTEPLNLGPKINSVVDDSGPSLSLDGSHLFFDSRRDEGYGGWDVYESTRVSPIVPRLGMAMP